MPTAVAKVKVSPVEKTRQRINGVMKRKLAIEEKVSDLDISALGRIADMAFHDSIGELHGIVLLPNEREEQRLDADGNAYTVTKSNIPFKIAASNSIVNAQRVIMDRKERDGDGGKKGGVTVTFTEEDRISGDVTEKKTTKTITKTLAQYDDEDDDYENTADFDLSSEYDEEPDFESEFGEDDD